MLCFETTKTVTKKTNGRLTYVDVQYYVLTRQFFMIKFSDLCDILISMLVAFNSFLKIF